MMDPFLDWPLDPAEWTGYFERCRVTGLDVVDQGSGVRHGPASPLEVSSPTPNPAPQPRELTPNANT